MNQSSAPLNTSEAMRNPLGANAMDLTLASIIDAGYEGSSGSPTGTKEAMSPALLSIGSPISTL